MYICGLTVSGFIQRNIRRKSVTLICRKVNSEEHSNVNRYVLFPVSAVCQILILPCSLKNGSNNSFIDKWKIAALFVGIDGLCARVVSAPFDYERVCPRPVVT